MDDHNTGGDLRQLFSPTPMLPARRGHVPPARWPRQETLTLLELRSTLNHKFKEPNHKAPLWDQLSRIMFEEHGYQRSGKKCKEKFENLYKYYKKTKDGKNGRQDGKSYRFFRQLDAICGQPESLSSSSDELETSSSDTQLNKIMSFIELQMRRIVEKQEAWLEKMVKMLESKEKERTSRNEEWRIHESERMEREHDLWAKERAWIDARDRALIDSLQKLAQEKKSKVGSRSIESVPQDVGLEVGGGNHAMSSDSFTFLLGNNDYRGSHLL